MREREPSRTNVWTRTKSHQLAELGPTTLQRVGTNQVAPGTSCMGANQVAPGMSSICQECVVGVAKHDNSCDIERVAMTLHTTEQT